MSESQGIEIIAEGKYLRLIRKNDWEYIERRNISGIVGIVAVTDEGNLVLVEQFRPALGKAVIELPAGLAGDTSASQGEDLTAAACRELLEETGYEASRMEFICEGPPSSGLTNEIITLFMASGLKKTAAGGGDETEDIVIHEVPVGDVRPWLEAQRTNGKLVDLRIYTGLYFVRENLIS